MRVRRIETVIRSESDQQASGRWDTRLVGIEPIPNAAPYFKFDEQAHLTLAPGQPGTGRGGSGIWFLVDDVDATCRGLGAAGLAFHEPPFGIPPGRLVTLDDRDGNTDVIDDSKGGMPGPHA